MQFKWQGHAERLDTGFIGISMVEIGMRYLVLHT